MQLWNIKIDRTKEGPVLLTVGTIIWRLISYWSSIDFILSVREERLAVLLESILDWGWLVLMIVGIIWFLLPTSATAEGERKDRFGLAFSFGILGFLFGIFVVARGSSLPPNVLTSWGGDARSCSAVINTEKLVGLKGKFHILLMCGIGDPRIDPLEDTRVAISNPFDITGSLASTQIGITADNGKMDDAIKSVPQGQAYLLRHAAVLLPTDTDLTEIKRVADVPRHGGRYLVDPPAGGFGMGVISGSPPPSNVQIGSPQTVQGMTSPSTNAQPTKP